MTAAIANESFQIKTALPQVVCQMLTIPAEPV